MVGFSVSANSDIEAFSQENDNKLKSGRDYQKIVLNIVELDISELLELI